MVGVFEEGSNEKGEAPFKRNLVFTKKESPNHVTVKNNGADIKRLLSLHFQLLATMSAKSTTLCE